MKFLVTGGSGFLGSHVADALSDEGHDVVIFDSKASKYLRDDQEMVVGSILDPDALANAMESVDVVYHFAAIADIDQAIHSPLETIEVNVMGTLHILEAAVAVGVKRFIFASSIYVYSQQGAFYRTSKQASENLIEDYLNRYSLSYTILRFGSLYGPRADNSNSVHRLIRQALTENRLEYAGTGHEVREYIHVSDGAAAAVEVLAPEFENEIIHLTGQERLTTRDMLEMIAEMFRDKVKVDFNNADRDGHYFQTPYSYTPKRGKKLVRQTYIDLGLGLLDLIEFEHKVIEDDERVALD